MSKLSRLRTHSEIRQVLSGGTKWESPFFNIVWLKNQMQIPRFAVVLSKRVGNAVVRNSIKRRLKEIFRTNKGSLPALDIIVVVKTRCSRQHHLLRECFITWKQSIAS